MRRASSPLLIERIVLAERAGRPIGRDLWERVSRVTCEPAATVARDIAGERYWKSETTLADLRAVYQRMLQHRDIADAFDDRDY
ncbi:hypothetical protein [Streptomyces sp. NPDC052496]|uniref:hypothetical protein n=1 Tax=Streptomyces sp. NPDC052496 TaxID=3154951 RepID=UPI00343EB833